VEADTEVKESLCKKSSEQLENTNVLINTAAPI
jgi:hypothetical protein